mmetsp:Transcript_35593/g.45891  ORF Transcript_35593/g.45891 Transcript_35593/m.45891 type:complete len:241 (+) Transcript_35593:1046-1768(+)
MTYEGDINAILDADYDTSTWSVHEIESACNTLMEECESTLVLCRRVLATRMLLRLIDRHDEARRFVEKAFETVVNRGIPAMSYGISDRTFCVAHLLAAISPRLAEKLSTLNVVPRIAKMITRFSNLAAQVIQNKVRVRAKAALEERQIEHGLPLPPPEVRARLRLMANIKTTDLNERFKRMRIEPMGGRLPPDGTFPALQTSLGDKDTQVITSTLEAFDVLATTAVMSTPCLKTTPCCLA